MAFRLLSCTVYACVTKRLEEMRERDGWGGGGVLINETKLKYNIGTMGTLHSQKTLHSILQGNFFFYICIFKRAEIIYTLNGQQVPINNGKIIRKY